MGELQLKRLNGIVAVLTNPQERARYESALQTGSHGPGPARRRKLLHLWYWMAALVCLCAAVFYLSPQQQSGKDALSPKTGLDSSSKQPAAVPRALTYIPRAASRRLEEPTAAVVPRAIQRESGETPRTDSSEDRPPPAAATSIPPMIATIEPPPAYRRSAIAGDWLFVPTPRAVSGGLYPPEYIELRVIEGEGLVRGRYRARYRVPDRAISPAVDFRFEGPAGSGDTSFPWRGAGGSQGEVTLRLLSGNALEVTWSASQLGSDLGLVSGTATLVRKLD